MRPRDAYTHFSCNRNGNILRDQDTKNKENVPARPDLPKIKVLPDDVYYDMSGEKHLIIFNHYIYKKSKYFIEVPPPRNGTDKDVARLTKVFKNLGFIVKEYNDLEYKAIVEVLLSIKETDHSATSCMAVAVLTHGDENGVIRAADRSYKLKEIIRLFDHHATLVGKPKLFFIQACRGGKTDSGTRVSTDGQPREYLFPAISSDTLVMRSSIEQYYSFREGEGSWLIQELCKTIEKYHQTMDLLHICTVTQRNIAVERISNNSKDVHIDKKKQMPETTFTLTKFVKF